MVILLSPLSPLSPCVQRVREVLKRSHEVVEGLAEGQKVDLLFFFCPVDGSGRLDAGVMERFSRQLRSGEPTPLVVYLPHGRWKAPALAALRDLASLVLSPQESVVRFMGEKGRFLSLESGRFAESQKNSYDLGMIGNWRDLYWLERNRVWEEAFPLCSGKKSFLGDDSEWEEISSCKVALFHEAPPAVSPSLLMALSGGSVVVINEEMKVIFEGACDLPVLYYKKENLVEVLSSSFSYEVDPRMLDTAREWVSQYMEKSEKELLSLLEKARTPSREWNQESLAILHSLNGENDEAARVGGDFLHGLSQTPVGKMGKALQEIRENQIPEAQQTLVELLEDLNAQGEIPEKWILPYDEEDLFEARFFSPSTSREERKELLKGKALEILAGIAWQGRRKEEALQLLKDALAHAPGDGFLSFKLGLLQMEKGMVAQPVRNFSEAIRSLPFFFQAQHHLAGLYAQMEIYDQALAMLRKSLAFPSFMNPQRVKMLNLLAYCSYQQGNLQEAREAFLESFREEKQPEIEKQLAVVYLKEAVTSFKEGGYGKARDLLQECLKWDPGQPLAHNLKGSLDFQEGEYSTAIEAFEKALNEDPELEVAQLNIHEAEKAREVVVSLILFSHGVEEMARRAIEKIQRSTHVKSEILLIRKEGAPPWSFLKGVQNLREIQLENFHAASAFNAGIRFARGEYLVFMEDDVMVGGGWFPALLEALEQEKVGMVGPATNYSSVPEQTAAQPVDSPVRNVSVETLDAFFLMARRDFFKDLGGFDEEFLVRGYEDRDLCLRARLHGWQLFCVPTVFVYHEGLMPVMDDPRAPSEIDEANMRHFTRKWEEFKAALQAER